MPRQCVFTRAAGHGVRLKKKRKRKRNKKIKRWERHCRRGEGRGGGSEEEEGGRGKGGGGKAPPVPTDGRMIILMLRNNTRKTPHTFHLSTPVGRCGTCLCTCNVYGSTDSPNAGPVATHDSGEKNNSPDRARPRCSGGREGGEGQKHTCRGGAGGARSNSEHRSPRPSLNPWDRSSSKGGEGVGGGGGGMELVYAYITHLAGVPNEGRERRGKRKRIIDF